MSQVHARLQSLLQDLPEVAEPAGQEGASLGIGPPDSGLAPAVDSPVGQTHRQTQSSSPNNPQADQAEDLGMHQPDVVPSPAVATFPNSASKQMQPARSAADEAATAVEDATTAEAHEAGVLSTVPIVCGSVQGTYTAKGGVVIINGGKVTKPNKVEIMAGKGAGKTWAETIQVDQGSGVAGVSLGKWIKDHRRSEARARRRTSPQGKQRTPPQRAKHSLSSAVVVADGTVQLDNQGFSKAQSLGPHAKGSVLKHVSASSSPSCSCRLLFCPTPLHQPSVLSLLWMFTSQSLRAGEGRRLRGMEGQADPHCSVWGWGGGGVMQGTP